MTFKFIILLCSLIFCKLVTAQHIAEKLRIAINSFEKDPQLENAQFGIYIADGITGKPVFEKNGNTGLATASCLKVITSATAMEVLGSQFRFKTKLFINGPVANGVLDGSFIIECSGDPSLGSWRWDETKEAVVMDKIVEVLQKNRIKKINGEIILNNGYTKNVTPSSWIWEDLGNYFGAPARTLNWHENQYDLVFSAPDRFNEPTSISKTEPGIPGVIFTNYVKTAGKGTGDQTIIFLPPFGNKGYITGTVPMGEKNFTVTGAMPDPTAVFGHALIRKLKENHIDCLADYSNTEEAVANKKEILAGMLELDSIVSPPLEKLNEAFMKKSINLYGEAFLNKIGQHSTYLTGSGDSKSGVNYIKNFWKERGISVNSLNIYDGSGLSPLNRVTTKTIVSVLLYAQKQSWFPIYKKAFPEYNNMQLKSGTINDVKGFSGYHQAKDGKQYIVSFLVNNYNGAASGLVTKMFKILDLLK